MRMTNPYRTAIGTAVLTLAAAVTWTGSAIAAPAPVHCGKIPGPKGQVDVIAEATKAGTVGCTEAINVISEYFKQAPTKAEGTADVLTVQGWRCMADTGAHGTGKIGCDKDGLAFHT